MNKYVYLLIPLLNFLSVSEERSSYRQILKATSIFGGVQVFNILISIVRSKIIAVLLGPAGMGIAGLLTSTTGLMSALTNFGLGTSAVKDIAEAHGTGDTQRMAKTVSVFRRLVWFTGLFGSMLTLVISPWLSELTFGDRSYTWSFVFLSVTLLIGQLTAGQNVILQGTRQLKYLASANMIGSVVSLLITLPLYYFYGLEGIVPALIVMSFGTLAVASYFSRKVTIPFYSPSFLEIKEKGKGMLKLGFFLSLSGLIATLVSYLLRIYISNTGSVDDVGLYSAGFQIIGTYVGLVFTAMGTDYYPRLAAVAGDQKQANLLVNQQAEIALLILLPIVLIFMVFIPLVVNLLYSEKFLPINEMIVWAAYGMFFKAGSWAIAFQFLAKGSSRFFFFNELSTNMYMFLLNILGYHYFGLTGLGFSFLLTYFIYFLQVLWLTNFKYQFKIQFGFIKFLLISLFFGACCLALISYFNGLLRYLIGGCIVGLGVIIAIWELEKRINLFSLLNWKR